MLATAVTQADPKAPYMKAAYMFATPSFRLEAMTSNDNPWDLRRTTWSTSVRIMMVLLGIQTQGRTVNRAGMKLSLSHSKSQVLKV